MLKDILKNAIDDNKMFNSLDAAKNYATNETNKFFEEIIILYLDSNALIAKIRKDKIDKL